MSVYFSTAHDDVTNSITVHRVQQERIKRFDLPTSLQNSAEFLGHPEISTVDVNSNPFRRPLFEQNIRSMSR